MELQVKKVQPGQLERHVASIGVDAQRATDSQRPKIVLFGLFGSSNLGNDATLSVTLHHLRQRLPAAEIVCVCRNPEEIQRIYGVKSLPVDPLPPWSFWRIGNRTLRNACIAVAVLITEPIRAMRVNRQLANVHQFLVVGTGVLDDFGELPWNMPAWLLRWCRGARKAGAVVRFVSVGAGPINNRVNRYLMTRAVRLSDYRSYRDAVSKEYLESIGVDARQDHVFPDLVFGLPAGKLASYRTAVNPPETIGVGVMGYYGWSNDEQNGRRTYGNYIEKMTRFVLWLLDQGYEVRLLLGQLNADERPIRDLLNAVSKQASTESRQKLSAPRIETLDDLLRGIADTDAVVATRYHNVICALALGRPVLSIGYASKFDALMREIGLEAYCQHIDELNVDRLIEQFLDLMSNHGWASDLVKEKTADFRKRLREMYDSLFDRGDAEGRI